MSYLVDYELLSSSVSRVQLNYHLFRVLKRQKEVLRNCIEENIASMCVSNSLDMVAVQEELDEVRLDCASALVVCFKQ